MVQNKTSVQILLLIFIYSDVISTASSLKETFQTCFDQLRKEIPLPEQSFQLNFFFCNLLMKLL